MKKHPIKENPHVGSSFESWLDEEGIREEVVARSRRRTKTSRAGIQRLHDAAERSGLATQRVASN